MAEIDLEVRGAEQFQVLAKALRQVGDKELRRELYAGINRATKPLRGRIKESAAEKLPHRGGLAKIIAGSKFSTRSSSGRNPGIRIMGRSKHNVGQMDRGRVRHPVFGNKQKWVLQSVPEGWFTEPIKQAAPQIRDELAQSMQDVAEKLLEKH